MHVRELEKIEGRIYFPLIITDNSKEWGARRGKKAQVAPHIKHLDHAP